MSAHCPLLDELKAATDAQHRQLEAHPWLKALTSSELTVDAYTKTLQCFSYYYGVLEAQWEPWLQQTGYAYTRRFPLLQKDLQDLTKKGGKPGGTSNPTGHSEAEKHAVCYPDSPKSLSEFAGMLYVIEGSSQGSRVIGPRLQRQFGFNRDYAARFFNIYQLAPNEWQHFRGWVEKNEQNLNATDSINSANQIFSTLYSSFKQCDALLQEPDRLREATQEGV